MRSKVIDGDDWLHRRISHLKEMLAAGVPDDERQAVDAEIALLSKERGLVSGGHRRSRLWRRLRGAL